MKRGSVLSLAFVALVLGGCAGLNKKVMPSNTNIVSSLCPDYLTAKAVYDSILPYKTTRQDLEITCFDPRQPNTEFLNARVIQGMFLPSPAVKKEDLPQGIQDCLKSFESCNGLVRPLKNLLSRGVGNFAKRAAKCRKEDLTTGPDASFQIFFSGDLVIYKDYSGFAEVHRPSTERKPLCIFQEPADFIRYIPPP